MPPKQTNMRAKEFVGRASYQIGMSSWRIEQTMCCVMYGIEKYKSPNLVGHISNLPYRVHSPYCVGSYSNRNKLRARIECMFQTI